MFICSFGSNHFRKDFCIDFHPVLQTMRKCVLLKPGTHYMTLDRILYRIENGVEFVQAAASTVCDGNRL